MNVAPGGWKYAIPPLLAAPFALFISAGAAIVAIAIGVATLAFFRDPDRSPPPTGVVAPCDGNVSVLREEDGRVRLGIFMNVWHVHVVRSPFAATVTDVEHVAGANKPAFSKESDRNERVHVRVLAEEEAPDEEAPDPRADASTDDTPTDATPGDGNALADEDALGEESNPTGGDAVPEHDATITLIAGAFARRIFPYVEADEELGRGQRIGHIAFGSRVDVLFPPSVAIDDLAVDVGDATTAGETVILESPDPAFDVALDVDPDTDADREDGEPA